jgi:hypothetical protein
VIVGIFFGGLLYPVEWYLLLFPDQAETVELTKGGNIQNSAEKTKHMSTSVHQNAGRNHVTRTVNKCSLFRHNLTADSIAFNILCHFCQVFNYRNYKNVVLPHHQKLMQHFG